jgi:internalin A
MWWKARPAAFSKKASKALDTHCAAGPANKPLLRGSGRFSRADLEALIWSCHTPEEQRVFLSMMESCGICFRVRELPHQEQLEWRHKEWEYIAPELLPEWSDAQELLLGRLSDDPPDAEATASYAFLHEGIVRGYLSKLGKYAKDAAIYWKYGCWFYEQTTRSQVLIESQWETPQARPVLAISVSQLGARMREA